MIFDAIAHPTSPLRQRLAAIAFWSLAPEMDDPDAAAAYFAECAAGTDPYPNFERSLLEQTARLARLRANAQDLVVADPRLASIEALLDDRECALVAQRQLSERKADMVNRLCRERRLRAAVRRRDEKEPLLRSNDVLILGPAAVWLIFSALSFFAWGDLAVSLFITSPALLLLGVFFALEWRSRFSARRRLRRRFHGQERQMRTLCVSLDMIGNLARQEPVLAVLGASGGSEGSKATATAPASEEGLRAALAAQLVSNSDRTGPLDVHYFLHTGAAILDQVGVPALDRSMTAPAHIWHRLSYDHCPESFIRIFKPALFRALQAGEDIPDGPLARVEELSWDLVAGSEDALEIRCHLPGETDLTVIRLALPKPAWPARGPDADNANLATPHLIRQISLAYPIK